MNDFFACLLTLAVGLFSHSPAFALTNENLLVGMPKGYKVAYQTRVNNMKITEMIPKSQDLKNWSEMVTVQVFLKDKKLTPIKFFNLLASVHSKTCKGSRATLIKKGFENGYAFSFFFLVCPLNPKTKKPEYTWFKTVRGKDSFYVVQKAWKKSPAKKALSNGRNIYARSRFVTRALQVNLAPLTRKPHDIPAPHPHPA